MTTPDTASPAAPDEPAVSSEPAAPVNSAGPAHERIVDAIGRAIAIVPSLGPARQAWERLGFICSGDFVYQGCRAFDVQLADGGIRVIVPDSVLPTAPLGAAAHHRMEHGAGLIGWTWTSRNPERARAVIESKSGTQFQRNSDGSRSFMADSQLTAGAVTLLEPATSHPNTDHPNGADHVDHLVLMVGDADAVAERIGDAFGLKPVARNMKQGRYSFCKVGATVLEIVGPPEPDKTNTQGRVWGITFAVPDIDETVAAIRDRGVAMPDPHDAIQGGRIVSVPTQVGGAQIAFMGE